MLTNWVAQGVWSSVGSSSTNEKERRKRKKTVSSIVSCASLIGTILTPQLGKSHVFTISKCTLISLRGFCRKGNEGTKIWSTKWETGALCLWCLWDTELASVQCMGSGHRTSCSCQPVYLQTGYSQTLIWWKFIIKMKQICNFCVSWLMKLRLWLLLLLSHLAERNTLFLKNYHLVAAVELAYSSWEDTYHLCSRTWKKGKSDDWTKNTTEC